MCGRYATTVDPALLAAELDAIDDSGGSEPNYNVVPTSPVLTVVRVPGVAERPLIRRMRWGFVAPWAEEFGAGPPLFNARAETVSTKPTFRDAARSRRCLVPMDGWYEWEAGLDAAGKVVKTPLYMSARDGSTLLMAGVWSLWGGGRASCAVLTTDSVGPLRPVHERMPLILPRESWSRWLDPAAGVDSALLAAPALPIAEAVDIRRVSRLVNSVRNNGPALLEPDADGPEQLTLM